MDRKILYAYEAVLYIACTGGAEAVSLKEVCASVGVSERYLEQTMQRLVHGGILRGVRGPKGGYLLAREKRKINLKEVLEIVDVESGAIEKTASSDLKDKVIRPLNFEINNLLNDYLNELTINDLFERAKGAGVLEKLTEKKEDFNI